MLYGLIRADYEELFTQLWDRDYPKNTNAAIEELRQRGLDADKSRLDYLMRKGEIQAVFKKGRNYKWSKANVDEAAEVLDRAKAFTKAAAAWAARHVLYRQYLRAFADARGLWPMVDTDLLVVSVYPYGYGLKEMAKSGGKGYEYWPYNLVVYGLDEKHLKAVARSRPGGPLRQMIINCLRQREVDRAILDEDKKIEKAAGPAKGRVGKKVARAIGAGKRRPAKATKPAKPARKRTGK